jgi:DNA-binding NarL/FixJ family response regulator
VIRVLIADDHPLVRTGLIEVLSNADDVEVVGAASGGREAVELAQSHRPDIVLMDLSMPDLDGISATREVHRLAPDSRVVVLTSFSDRDRILGALQAGAIGYLLKDAAPPELLAGIRAAARGESPLAPKAAQHLVASHRRDPRERLSEREQEVLALLAQGTPNKLIAQRLDIAEKTVKNHVSRIFQVLEVGDRTQAALWAHEHGITSRNGS